MERASPHLPMVAQWLRSHGFEIRRPDTIPNLRLPKEIEPYGCHVSYYEAALRGECVWGLADGGVCWCIGCAPQTVRAEGDRPVIVLMRPCANPLVPHLRHFVPRLVRDLGYLVIMKNVGEVEAEELVTASGAFRPYSTDECWHPTARSDEQTFPEVVLDVSKSGIANRPDVLLRRRAEAPDEQLVSRLFDEWLAWFLDRHPAWNEWELRPYYFYWLGEGRFARYRYAFIYECDGKAIGFACGDKVGEDQAQFWTCLVPPGARVSTRAVYADFFGAAASDGVRWVNLGGSEERSLHRFKYRLGPNVLLHRGHLICDPRLLSRR